MVQKKIGKTEHSSYDCVIVGGGLAGLTLAVLMGKVGIHVAVIDAADPSRAMSGDERTTAISYGSSKILHSAGIWDKLAVKGCPIRDIRILDGDSPVLLGFMSHEVNNKDFGTILLNADIRQALREAVDVLETVTLIAPASVQDFSVGEDHVSILLKNGETLQAKLAVGADGRNSFMREWLDIPCRRWSYGQRAVVCIVRHEHPHHNVAVEHFWPEGPFAILPMADDEKTGAHRSSIVFTEHTPEQKSLMRLSRNVFELALQNRFPEEYGQVGMIGERSVYPLGLVHASRYIDRRMVLIADAAHGIHPIAGQGLNLGFRDVKELAELVIHAHQSGADIGAAELLETYQRRRRPDNMAMVAFTDTLVRLFSNRMPLLRTARRIGLKAVAKLPPAKRFFMRQAMADRDER